MKKRFLLFIIFIIFVISSITLSLILNYFDPEQYRFLAFLSLIFTFLLGVSSFFCIVLYFIKKVYYRGRVEVYHVLTSFRQGFFISLFLSSIVYFLNIGASILLTAPLVFIILFLLELFIKNQEI